MDDASAPDARVVWTSSHEVRVDVVPRASGEEPLSRRVAFRQEDSVDERFRSAGLVVAALAAEQASAEEEHVREAERRSGALVTVGASAVTGRGLDPGPFRYGASAHAGYRWSVIPLFAFVRAEYAVADHDAEEARPAWAAFGAGAGMAFVLHAPNIELRPHLDAVLERLAASIDVGKKETSTGERWLLGSGAGAEIVWPADSPLALLGGASGRFLSGGTAIRVANEKESSFPAISYSFQLGMELRLPP